MTIINPNSISGISSITALNSTAAINLFKDDGTAANIITGITTGTNFKTGSSNLHSVGIEIAGINVLGADTPIGAGATIYNSGDVIVGGAVTATAFSGSGASLTSLPAQATIANNANNRVITGGSGVNLNGESNLTFDGSTLSVAGNIYMGDSNRIYIGASNDAYIYHDTANTHFVNGTGHLQIRQTANSDVITQTNAIDRVRIYNDGLVAIGQSSKSSTAGAGNLDIQGNATNCIIEMGNPFPTFSGGVVPEFRITATNSGHEVKFESIWGGDNLLHKHLSFAGGNTDVYDGTYNNQIARFDGNGRLFLNGTTVSNTNDTLTVKRAASGFTEMSMTVDANTATGTHANAFVFTKSKNTYWNGLGFQSSHGHIGAIVGMRDSTGMNASQKIRIELGGTGINASEEKTWDFLNDGNLSISDGNLKLASGHGIDFSATGGPASGTGGSELLDDYEEGTFSPGWFDDGGNFVSSYSVQYGQYTKIGNVVYFCFGLRIGSFSRTPNSGQACRVGNLPFVSREVGDDQECVFNLYARLWGSGTPPETAWIRQSSGSGSNHVEFYMDESQTGNDHRLVGADFSTSDSCRVVVNGFYYVS